MRIKAYITLTFPFTLSLALALSFLVSVNAFCQGKARNPIKKSLGKSFSSINSSTYDFDFSSTFDDIVSSSTDTDLYESLTIKNLRRLKEDAQPSWHPEDIDPYKTRRIVEKALAIQTGRSVTRLLNKSELRNTYKRIKRGFMTFRDYFRYSVQSDGTKYLVSKNNKGKKILELNLEFNARQGVDPQIRIGQSLRFRYDYVEKRPVLEYGFDF